MKLDFNTPITGLDGAPIPDTHAGKLLANVLVSQSDGDIIKLFDWATRMHRGETVDLDRADRAYLTNFIRESKQLTLLVKKQLLDIAGRENGEL